MNVKGYFLYEQREFFILFLSTLKWIGLSILSGITASLGGFVFLRSLELVSSSYQKIPYFYLLAPIGLLTSRYLISTFAPEAKGHGTEKVIEAIHKRFGNMDIKVVPVKLIATILTLTLGGSAGKEGPVAQIGASIASFLGKILHLSQRDLRKFVMCGLSAGFAAVFGTPVAGAVFGIEVLYVGHIEYTSIMSSTISSFVSVFFIRFLGIHNDLLLPVSNINVSFTTMLWAIIFGFFIALIARLFINLSFFMEKLGEKIDDQVSHWFTPIVGGLVLVVFGVLGFTPALGVGMTTIQQVMRGESVASILWVIKILAVTITLGMGGSGGVVTPMFFIGSVFGMHFAHLFSLNSSFWSQVGLVTFLGACANTPLSAVIMACELFGFHHAIPVILAVTVAYKLLGHRSIYPSQLLLITKSMSIDVPLGEPIVNAQTGYIPRRKNVRKQSLDNLF